MSSDQPTHRLTIAVLARWIDQRDAKDDEDNKDLQGIAVEVARLASRESVPVLAVLTRAGDRWVQVTAALALARLGEPLGLATLETLRHQGLDWVDRQHVAEALGQTGSPAALEPLLDMLNDSDYDVRTSAVKSLGLLRQDAAIPALRQTMERDDNKIVRVYAAEALAKLEEPADKTSLLRLVRDSNSITQYLGARGLLELGDPAGIEALAKLANSEGEYVPRIAAAALCSGAVTVPMDPLLAMTQSQNPYVRASAAKALGRLPRQEPFEVLLGMAGDEKEFVLFADDPELFQLAARTPLRVCAVAAEAIASSRRPEAVEKLLELAEYPDPAVSEAAIKALASRSGLVDDETVSRWAHDPAEQIRQAAAELMGIRRAPRALDDLLALGDDPSIAVRAAAAAAMGSVGDPRALDQLMSGLDDSAWQVRLGAATGLEAMARQAVDSLIQLVGQTTGTGQPTRAIWVLDKLGDPADVRPVILARGTGEPTIWQRVAAEAVEAGDSTVAGSLVTALRDDNSRVRESAAEALAVLGDRNAVIPLTALLGDPDWEVRLAARATLGRLGPSAVDLMAVALREGNRNVRAGVANMLGKLQAREAVDPLMRALGDSGRLVRANAAEALGRIGDPRAVDPLIHAVRDSDRGVRNNAAVALRRIGTPEALAAVRDWTLARRRGATFRSG